VKEEVSNDKIRKCPFRTDVGKQTLVLRVDLDAQTHGQDEASHGGDEAGQERVEGEGAHEETVHELGNAGEQDVDEVGVHNLELLGRLGVVLCPELAHHS